MWSSDSVKTTVFSCMFPPRKGNIKLIHRRLFEETTMNKEAFLCFFLYSITVIDRLFSTSLYSVETTPSGTMLTEYFLVRYF